MIPFNKPYLQGKELFYIAQAVSSGKISGDGIYTRKCHEYFESRYGFKKTLLTTSCTDALEMAAILLNIQPGDEVIAPSYTFVSTVNAFAIRGAKIIFVDSCKNNPNIDPARIREKVTDKTKAIIIVHYAGVACDIDEIMSISKENNIPVVEDAAQAIDSYYKGKPLGSFGCLSAFSFHETKNIISGEGGLLVINDEKYFKRAEIIREKGTNRSSFFRGEVDKYGWVDIGSSFLPSDIISAYLYAQLEYLDDIQNKRKELWNIYYKELSCESLKGRIELPDIPNYATNNAHMFYIICGDLEERSELISFLASKGIHSVFHYLSLHNSEFFKRQNSSIPELSNSDRYSDALLRLPMYYELRPNEIIYICDAVKDFYRGK